MRDFEVRHGIDEVDAELVRLLEERLSLVRRMASYKRSHERPIYDEARERAVLESRLSLVSDARNRDYVESMMLNMMAASRREQRRGMNVYLVGMPGCGKTTIALKLSEKLGINCIDTDALVEQRAVKPITEIFRYEGEQGFRKREREALISAAATGYSVVATGGGILTTKGNDRILKSSGRVVFLDRKLDKLVQVDMEKRPLISTRADVERLYERRYAAYAAAADITVDPDKPETFGMLVDYCRE